VFLAGLVLAQLLGVALDVVGRSMISVTLANLGGAAVLMLVAAICDWFKGSPWSKSRERRKPEEAPEPASVPRTMAAPRLAS
jgi:hypothetical protein